jgi:hypothetical protein
VLNMYPHRQCTGDIKRPYLNRILVHFSEENKLHVVSLSRNAANYIYFLKPIDKVVYLYQQQKMRTQ